MNQTQIDEVEHFSCRFCDHLARQDTIGVDAPWLTGPNHSAFISIGAMVPGWSLVVTRDHRENMASEYSKTDFWDFLAETTSTLERIYGSVAIFEHGASDPNSFTSCGTGHAHLHVVPLPFCLTEATREYEPKMTWIECKLSDVEDNVKDREYLFFSDKYAGRETKGSLCLLEKETSQFFRKVIALNLGIPEDFNYKQHPQRNIVNASLKNISDFFLKEPKSA